MEVRSLVFLPFEEVLMDSLSLEFPRQVPAECIPGEIRRDAEQIVLLWISSTLVIDLANYYHQKLH